MRFECLTYSHFSPYRFHVLPTVEPEKVLLVSGEDVVPLGEIPASLPYTFTIDTRNAGYANLEVSVLVSSLSSDVGTTQTVFFVQGPDKLPCQVNVLDRGNGVYDVTFVPQDVGSYNVVMKYGGEEISHSPYHVVAHPVGDASKCFIIGKRILNALIERLISSFNFRRRPRSSGTERGIFDNRERPFWWQRIGQLSH